MSQAYGLSEASAASHISLFYHGNASDSIGLPLPDTMAKIVDIESGGKECAVGEIGELVISGPQLMRGYWKDPERTREVLRDG